VRPLPSEVCEPGEHAVQALFLREMQAGTLSQVAVVRHLWGANERHVQSCQGFDGMNGEMGGRGGGVQ